jgi:predicted transcriptional regulator
MQGKTQNEISNELGKHQTTIHKILQGNIDYNNQKKRYGGALKKIRKLCQKNEKVQSILVKMREKHEEGI